MLTKYDHNVAAKAFRLAIAAVVTMVASFFTAGTSEATLISRLSQASPGGDLLFEDQSREMLVVADSTLGIRPGDVLFGYLRIDDTAPGGTVNNSIYVVFSHTFAADFAFQTSVLGTRYSGTFVPTPAASPYSLESLLGPAVPSGGINAGAMLAVLEVPGGFSQDLVDVNLNTIGGVAGAITSVISAEGTVRFTAGLANAEDFWAYQTARLGTTIPDFVADPSLVTTLGTGTILGAFGAGLSITDNYYGDNYVQFNRVLTTNFGLEDQIDPNDGVTVGYDPGAGNLYQLVISPGTFNGIRNTDGTLINNAQLGDLSFINKANAIVNVTIIPEPGTLVMWGLLGGVGFIVAARRRRVSAE